MEMVAKCRDVGKCEGGRTRGRKTKKENEGKIWFHYLQIKGVSEQRLQAGLHPSTCCGPTAKSNTLFQETHCLMTSVERALPEPTTASPDSHGMQAALRVTETHNTFQKSPCLIPTLLFTHGHILQRTRDAHAQISWSITLFLCHVCLRMDRPSHLQESYLY